MFCPVESPLDIKLTLLRRHHDVRQAVTLQQLASSWEMTIGYLGVMSCCISLTMQELFFAVN